ncbi:MAG: PEGA domain-containing protein [Patescibacteria group bacterium]
MNIKHRRLITLIFISIFFIVTPILLLYTAGYRYNLKKLSLQKTGAMVIKTEPSGALIFFNGQSTKDYTPTRINNVLPDEYLVSAEKEGYYSWQKKMLFESQKTTFAEDIFLFKIFTSEPVSEEKYSRANLNEKKFGIYSTFEKNQTVFFLLIDSSAKSKQLFSLNGDIQDWRIFWDNEQTVGLFTTKNELWQIKTGIPRSAEKLPFTSPTLQKALFYENELYLLIDNRIQKYQNNKLVTIYQADTFEKLLDFSISNNQLFIVKNLLQKTVLTKEPLNETGQIEQKSLTLKNENSRLLGHYGNKILLVDNEERNLFVLNESIDRIEFTKKDILGFDFLTDKNRLLIYTGQEISFLNLSDENLSEKLLTRFSENIQKVLWHASGNYIFILQNNIIKIFEVDDRNGHFSLDLPENDITDFTVDAKSETLILSKEQALWSYEMN